MQDTILPSRKSLVARVWSVNLLDLCLHQFCLFNAVHLC